MYLKRIDIYGFKSFAQEVHLEFPDGITVLVGPNGGGKSNVVDAIRWALGEGRVRELRAERWEDLLFNGSAVRAAARMAEVTLTFDNADREMADWPESLAVCRRYYRSGQTDYLLNGRVVRLKDITDLFLDSGLGRFNYAVIGQGRVEAALLQKPQERFEQLEEAAGVSRYKVRRKETVAHLAEASERLKRIADLSHEVQQQMQEVADQAHREERYLALEGEAKALEERLTYTAYRAAMAELEQLERAHRAASAERAALAKELETLEQTISERQKEMADTEVQANSLAEQSRADEAALVAQQVEIGRLEAEIAGLEREAANIERQLEEMEAQNPAPADGPADEPDEGDDRLAALAATEKAYQDALAQWESELKDVMARRQVQESRRRELADRRQERERQLARLAGALKVGQDEELREVLRARRQEAAGLEQTVRELTAELVRLTDKRQNLRSFVQTVEAELQSLRHQAAQRQARLRALHQLEAEGEGLSLGVRAVLKAQQEGRLEGVLGTLGSLITSDAALTLAVQTALGGSGQDLVVLTEQHARLAVGFLKSHALGRATFLPLDTIRMPYLPDADRPLDRQPGVVGWAVNLVDYSKQIRPAVMHVLGRVLITQTLDDAVRLGRLHRFRYKMATIDGQLIHAGGAITGGTRVNRDSRSARLVEIQGLTKRVEEETRLVRGKEELLAGSREELNGVEQEIDALREILSDRRHRWSALREDLKEGEQWADPEEMWRLHQEDADNERQAEDNMRRAQERLRELEGLIQDTQKALAEVARERVEAETRRREAKTMAAQKQIEAERTARQKALLATRRHDLGLLREKAVKARNALQVALDDVLGQREAAKTRQEALTRHISALREQIGQGERRQRALAYEDRRLANLLAEAGQEMVKIRTRWESYQPPVKVQELTDAERTAVQNRLSALRRELGELGPVVPGSLAVYRQLDERRRYLVEEERDVVRAQDALQATLKELDQEVERRITATANRVQDAFAQACRVLYDGGDGGFTWVGERLDGGIELWVKSSAKRSAGLSLLSGGEKALGGIAWLFALLSVRPSPFVVLDEVEASLDEANAARFAAFLAGQRNKTQYIVVSHHKETMEIADALWGVASDGHGQSRLVSVRLEKAGSI